MGCERGQGCHRPWPLDKEAPGRSGPGLLGEFGHVRSEVPDFPPEGWGSREKCELEAGTGQQQMGAAESIWEEDTAALRGQGGS